MRTLLFAALALTAVSGCGFGKNRCSSYQCGTPYQPGPGQPQVDPYTFLIDANAAIELPQSTLGITTNGRDWVLAWQGDAYPRQFYGTISSASGISAARYDNAGPGDSAGIVGGQLQFQGYTDAVVPQNLLFSSFGQPVTFDLYIEQTPAVGRVVFPSMGYLATTDIMPFSLVSDNATFSTKTERAPEFVATPPEEGQAEHIITVRAPVPKAAESQN